jgi:hypothetical protein
MMRAAGAVRSLDGVLFCHALATQHVGKQGLKRTAVVLLCLPLVYVC